MDFFKELEEQCKRIEREKNKAKREFVTKKINIILNMKYILEESYDKKIGNLFEISNGYRINLDKLISYTDEIIEIQSNITTNGESSESQRTFSKNNYELNLVLTINEKNDFIQLLKELEYKYNSLDEIDRKLIYYTLIEKENNTWLALNTNYSERTISTLKTKAINEFYRHLKLGKFTHKESLKLNHAMF